MPAPSPEPPIPLITEAITSGPEEEFISMTGSEIDAFAAVETILFEIAGDAAAVFLEAFTLCSTAPAGLGGGAVNLSFSLRPCTTCTTRMAPPAIRRIWRRMLRIRKLPLHAIQRCQSVRLIG